MNINSPGEPQVGDARNSTAGARSRIMSAYTLYGGNVKNPDGEELGRIESIMLDVPTGRVAYAVLSFGGILGMGKKLFAVPWAVLQIDPDDACFVLDVPKEHLKHAPGFDADHWPAMTDYDWATSVHRYYGSPLYWE